MCSTAVHSARPLVVFMITSALSGDMPDKKNQRLQLDLTGGLYAAF